MRDPDISLTKSELALLSAIRFDWDKERDLRDSIAPMEELALSLLARNAVPAVRLAYFTDPELNPSGRGKSRQDIFEKNGTSGEEILRHPHFLPHLKYFIYGPDLPAAAIEKFKHESRFSHLSG